MNLGMTENPTSERMNKEKALFVLEEIRLYKYENGETPCSLLTEDSRLLSDPASGRR